MIHFMCFKNICLMIIFLLTSLGHPGASQCESNPSMVSHALSKVEKKTPHSGFCLGSLGFFLFSPNQKIVCRPPIIVQFEN